MSDGEIIEDFSEISSEEDDYFEHLKKLGNRKRELELENSLAIGQFGKSAFLCHLSQLTYLVSCHFKAEKENRYKHHRPAQMKKKRLQSGSRYDSSREATRNRSYRASSVFSHYSIPKRRKPERWRLHQSNQRTTRTQSRKERRTRPKEDSAHTSLNKKERTRASRSSDEASSDEELLELRLNALKSKQELRGELINDEPELLTVPILPTEEDDLRILALKSTLIKKTPLLLERKKKKKLEMARPYSPSDDVTTLPMPIDDDDAMVLSPLGSPFNEVELNQEIDMDISNSPEPGNEDKESSDMDIAPSPKQIVEQEGDANDEEIALRSMLLCSITSKKEAAKIRSPTPETPPDSGTENSLALNLKLAVQRIKQKQQSSKSGSKTIAMILAEQRNKKAINKDLEVPPLHVAQQIVEETITQVNSAASQSEDAGIPLDVSIQAEMFLRTITNDLNKPAPVRVENGLAVAASDTQTFNNPLIEADTPFSTITDTKNIPLLPRSNKTKRSRLITSLVKRTVSPLVITVNTGSDTDEDSRRVTIKNTATKLLKSTEAGKSTAKTSNQIESFLKQVRLQQEKSGKEKTLNDMKPPQKIIIQSKSAISVPVTKSSSSVKHLPIASQIEYEQLVKKMKTLEAKQKEKARIVKQKSDRAKTPLPVITPIHPSPKKQLAAKLPDKIAESCRQISQLNKDVQQSLMAKAEGNYRKHRCFTLQLNNFFHFILLLFHRQHNFIGCNS